MRIIPRRRVWSEEEIESIKNLYILEGKKLSEIGSIFGTKGDTISKILKSKGVPINRANKNRLLKHDFFEEIDSEEKAYFLGLMTADGNITPDVKKERSPMIKIELIDKEILEILSRCTNTDAEVKTVRREGRNETYLWAVRSEKMASDLAKLDIVPNKTELMLGINNNIRNDLKRHYVRGLVDGDGSIYYSGNSYHVSFTTKHLEFAREVQDIFRELTGKTNIKKITCYQGVHKIIYSGKDAVKLCDILYANSNLSIDRKRLLAEEIIKIGESKRLENKL